MISITAPHHKANVRINIRGVTEYRPFATGPQIGVCSRMMHMVLVKTRNVIHHARMTVIVNQSCMSNATSRRGGRRRGQVAFRTVTFLLMNTAHCSNDCGGILSAIQTSTTQNVSRIRYVETRTKRSCNKNCISRSKAANSLDYDANQQPQSHKQTTKASKKDRKPGTVSKVPAFPRCIRPNSATCSPTSFNYISTSYLLAVVLVKD